MFVILNYFIGLIEFIFTSIPDVQYFMSENLCQDQLEFLFGKQRMRGGYSDNPNVRTFLYGTVSDSKISAVVTPKQANCKGSI